MAVVINEVDATPAPDTGNSTPGKATDNSQSVKEEIRKTLQLHHERQARLRAY